MSITPKSKDIKLEPGDQLIRIYKGTLIEVDVLDSGYKWNDEVYPTLTHPHPYQLESHRLPDRRQ